MRTGSGGGVHVHALALCVCRGQVSGNFQVMMAGKGTGIPICLSESIEYLRKAWFQVPQPSWRNTDTKRHPHFYRKVTPWTMCSLIRVFKNLPFPKDGCRCQNIKKYKAGCFGLIWSGDTSPVVVLSGYGAVWSIIDIGKRGPVFPGTVLCSTPCAYYHWMWVALYTSGGMCKVVLQPFTAH